MVTGHGKGAETYLASAGTAERRGFADATRDLDRTIRLARCPRCKRRNPGALLRFVGFFAGICLAMVALGFIFSAVLKMGDMWWLMPAILAGTSILITPAQMANRWRSLDERVRWL